MKRNLTLAGWLLAGATLFAQDQLYLEGKRLFFELNCHLCHHPSDDAASIGPSLRTIAAFYIGNERRLAEFLEGKAPPIVDPARFFIMKPQLYKTMHLTFDEQEALVRFLTTLIHEKEEDKWESDLQEWPPLP